MYSEDVVPPQIPQFAMSETIGLSYKTYRESRQLQRTDQLQSIRKEQQLQRQRSRSQPSRNTKASPSIPQITVESDTTIANAESQEEWPLPLSKPISFERSQEDDQSISESTQDVSVKDPYTTAVKRKRWAIGYANPLFPVDSVLWLPTSKTAARSPSSTRLTANESHPPVSASASLKTRTATEDVQEEVEISYDDRSPMSEDGPPIYDVTRPTCSIMLVCYRSGPKPCKSKQVEVVSRSRFNDVNSFKQWVNFKPELLRTDRQFFQALRRVYLREMCSIWRRLLSLKTLRSIRLLSYTHGVRPKAVPLDDVDLQDILYAYNNPSTLSDSEDETPWINWVYGLRKPYRRHAIEFVEGWDQKRIAIAGTLPWLFSTIVGVVWSAKGGDVQTAFTVAGFLLTSGT
ncbi:hypothetical protein GP486_006339, partial [Trichoglossum hirsutum]